MVEEAEQRNARERWWQRSPERLLIPNSVPQEASATERAELQAAHSQIESIIVERDENAMRRWMDVRYDLPLEWQDAQWIGNLRMWGTAAEVREFVQAVIGLAEPLRKVPEPGDSGRLEVHFTFRVLPQQPEP
jgi:hypothetical protein